MKKAILVLMTLIVIIGVGFGAYYLGTKKSGETADTNQNQNLNTNKTTDTSAGQEEKEFSAAGEKINDPLYNENFMAIKIGSVAKEAERGAPFREDNLIEINNEYIQFEITTYDSFPEQGRVSVKGYNLDKEEYKGETINLELRRGTNTLCCYPTPEAGLYEVLFYYENSLIKVLEIEVR